MISPFVQRARDAGKRNRRWIKKFQFPGKYTSLATHKAMNGKPFLISEGMYDRAVRRKILPGELVACQCTYKDFVPRYRDLVPWYRNFVPRYRDLVPWFGDKVTPEIQALPDRAGG